VISPATRATPNFAPYDLVPNIVPLDLGPTSSTATSTPSSTHAVEELQRLGRTPPREPISTSVRNKAADLGQPSSLLAQQPMSWSVGMTEQK
jgi:hypothetical protein